MYINTNQLKNNTYSVHLSGSNVNYMYSVCLDYMYLKNLETKPKK